MEIEPADLIELDGEIKLCSLTIFEENFTRKNITIFRKMFDNLCPGKIDVLNKINFGSLESGI